jgi:hypothetical protein
MLRSSSGAFSIRLADESFLRLRKLVTKIQRGFSAAVTYGKVLASQEQGFVQSQF